MTPGTKAHLECSACGVNGTGRWHNLDRHTPVCPGHFRLVLEMPGVNTWADHTALLIRAQTRGSTTV